MQQSQTQLGWGCLSILSNLAIDAIELRSGQGVKAGFRSGPARVALVRQSRLRFDFGASKFEGDGAQGRNRTTDTRIFSPLLYRLSYLGIGVHCEVLYRDAGDSFGRADNCGASVA